MERRAQGRQARASCSADGSDFETHLEFGLRARLGRTLELTGALAAEVPVDDIDHLAALVIEARDDLVAQIELIPETESFEDPKVYLRGLLERTTTAGRDLPSVARRAT